MGSKKSETVELGDMFRRLAGIGTVWQVEFIYMDEAGIPHARVHDVKQPGDRRTLAMSVLQDREQYEPVRNESA